MLLALLGSALVLNAEVVTERFNKYLKNDPTIAQQVRIEENGVVMLDERGQEEQKVFFNQLKPRIVRPRHRLKVAIDPGHFGGEYARLEHRSFLVGGKRIQEGDLTFQTAVYLKELLEAEGVEVFMTRQGLGQGSIKEPYIEANESFKPYNIRDLKERARQINAFDPDLTVCIHYNLYSGEGTICAPAPQNFCCAFVPGGFGKGELTRMADRGEFLRLLLSDDIERSIQLSQCILRAFEHELKVPCQTNRSHLKHIMKWAGRGIFARNLVLTREIKGPICYGETLCMDAESEYLRLNEARLREVAQAYLHGIQHFVALQSP